PKRRADRVKQQKAPVTHSILAGHGRSQRGQAGYKLGIKQRGGAAAAEGLLGAADADGWLKGKFAKDAQNVVAVAPPDQEPGCVRGERGDQRSQQCQEKTDLALRGKRSRG